jgi:hypothetical protein
MVELERCRIQKSRDSRQSKGLDSQRPPAVRRRLRLTFVPILLDTNVYFFAGALDLSEHRRSLTRLPNPWVEKDAVDRAPHPKRWASSHNRRV